MTTKGPCPGYAWLVYANRILKQQGPDLAPGENRLLRRIARQCRATARLTDMVMQLPEPEGYKMHRHRLTWEQQLDAWTKVPNLIDFRTQSRYGHCVNSEISHRLGSFIFERKMQIVRMHVALGHEKSTGY